MNLTELEALHSKVLKMSCCEFEQWLTGYCEESEHKFQEAYDEGYENGYSDGVEDA